MVRVTALAAAVGACLACTPAYADVLPTELPSAPVPAVQQAAETVTPVATQVTKRVPVVAPAADHAVRTATAAAEPAVAAAETTMTVRVAQGRAGGSGGLRVGASSLRRAPPARLRQPTPDARASTQPAPTRRPTAAHVTAPSRAAATSAAASANPAGSHAERTSGHQGPPSAWGDGGISAAVAFAGGLAVLAAALTLMAPRLRRRLSIDLAALRPVAFVALPERPG